MSGVSNPVDVTAALNGILTTRGDILRRGATTVERLALGASGNTVQSDGTDVLYAAGGGGAVTREGGNTTEATTTSTTAVDLLTAATLTIAVGEPFIAFCSLRKTTGAAANARAGLKLNATTVLEAKGATQWSSSTDQVEQGFWQIYCGARRTSYLSSGLEVFGSEDAAASQQEFDQADIPNVEITDLIVRGEVSNALVTMGAVDLQVYSLSSS